MIKSSKFQSSMRVLATHSAPGYVVNQLGDVYGRRGRALTVCMSGRGYLFVRTVHGTRYIHRLIAEAFIPLEDDAQNYLNGTKADRDKILRNYIVRHKDGNKLNNVIENLQWVKR